MASTSAANQSVKLTKTVVEKLARPTTGQRFVRDAQLMGFGVRNTAWNGARLPRRESHTDAGRVRQSRRRDQARTRTGLDLPITRADDT